MKMNTNSVRRDTMIDKMSDSSKAKRQIRQLLTKTVFLSEKEK